MDMKNLKVGDKVRVISEEEVRKKGNGKEMFPYCGKVLTIEKKLLIWIVRDIK